MSQLRTSIEVAPVPAPALATVLTAEAIDFVVDLHDHFGDRRVELLEARARRRGEVSRLAELDFLPETAEIRDGEWTVAAPRDDYLDRRVEITGPTDRKMVINALNSGARGFMADFEDALAPTWENLVAGQWNLADAVRGTLSYTDQAGRRYEVDEERATLVPRPRGWHLPERHVVIGGAPASGALVDFGLFAFHCARELLERGSAPYLYLPKLEHHLEARLWNDVLGHAERALGLPLGSFRATVLIETFPAAFQMDEILWELRDHSYGLNAGRWDYIVSLIKTGHGDPAALLPDRADVTMTVPFMRAYTERLVQTCHRRGTFAMGGMAALVPSRANPEATERAIEAVRADKRREATDGFDGTWVAHPDVVAAAMGEFDAVLGSRPNQIARLRPEVSVTAAQLVDVAATPGGVTEQGLRNNLSVAFQYISFWLCGQGAAAINNTMEDAATAEIARSQVWHWMRHGAVTPAEVRRLLDEELDAVRAAVGEETWSKARPDEAREVLESLLFAEVLPEFLTSEAYPRLP